MTKKNNYFVIMCKKLRKCNVLIKFQIDIGLETMDGPNTAEHIRPKIERRLFQN